MKKVVVIGGGTGTYTAITGLKNYTSYVTAIVSEADSGGSSGILRDEFGILPPGDVTRCLVALAEDAESRSKILRQLFDYRFNGTQEKHKLGNLIITALEDIVGSFWGAVETASMLLNITGRVCPVTPDKAHLYARLENGEVIKGETNIDIPKHDPQLRINEVWLEPRCFSYRKAVEAIMDADLVVIGPGDLYTSVIPNLLVEGIPEALHKSSGKKVYVSNVMTKHGETTNFKLSDFVQVVEHYLQRRVSYILANSERPNREIEEHYAKEHSFFVEPDLQDSLEQRVIKTDLLSSMKPDKRLFRHDPQKLARAIMDIL